MIYQIRYKNGTTRVKNDETNPFCRNSLKYNGKMKQFKYRIGSPGGAGYESRQMRDEKFDYFKLRKEIKI